MKIIKAQLEKKLIIMRGMSGSGKSTKAKNLAGESGVVYSTDDFFINPDSGEYEFNPRVLGKNHLLNANRTEEAMQKGISPIVIDNTNSKLFEMKKYVKLAQKYEYSVEFHEPDTSWAWDAEELAKRNTHGVQRKSIDRMLNNWDKNPTVEDILKSKAPWEK